MRRLELQLEMSKKGLWALPIRELQFAQESSMKMVRSPIVTAFVTALFALLGIGSTVVLANTVAVSQLAGVLSVQKPDGSIRVLSPKSEISSGDVLSTQRDSFAEIKFSDGAKVTLKPNTSVKIETFIFQEAEPAKDSFVYGLLKGGLRAVTGLVGKRNPDAYRLGTATATIGIRGTTFTADDCISSECLAADGGRVAQGVIVGVQDGEFVASNQAGSQNFLAGQFGMMDSAERRPRFLSTDPGLQFAPPASFIQSLNTGSALNAGRSLECVVRR